MVWKSFLKMLSKHKDRPVSLKTSLSGCRHKGDAETDTTEEFVPDESADCLSSGTKCNDRDAMRGPSSSGGRLVVVACAVSVVCLCMLSVCGLFIYFHLKDKMLMSLDENSRSREVCMPCAQVMPNPARGTSGTTGAVLDTLELRQSGDEGEEKECCAHSPAQYAALFKLVLERQEEATRLAEILKTADAEASEAQTGHTTHHGSSSSIVSAHLALKPPKNSTGKTNSSTLRWKSPAESPRSHVRPGLKLDNNGEIVYVITPGLYFLYCQSLYSTAYSDRSQSVVSTYVTRHSLAYPSTSGILLKSRHTPHDVETDRHSNYVGGLVKLHRGDQLVVLVSLPRIVSHDDSASFFGLFRVGD